MPYPKGPFRTKRAIALETAVFYYCRSALLSVPSFPQDKKHLETLRRSESLWPQ